MKNKIDETVRDYSGLVTCNSDSLKELNEELVSSKFLVETVQGITNHKDDNEAILQAVMGIFLMACLYSRNNPHNIR